jgi:diguanylate cyclase (GGDEF)-like protein
VETLDYDETAPDNKRRIFDLKTMIDIGKTLNASLSLNDVLDIVVLTCKGHFHSSECVIFLASDDREQPCFLSQAENTRIEIEQSDPLIQYINENQRVFSLEELKGKARSKNVYSILEENEIDLIVPLRFKGKINGILCLKKKEKEFGEEYTEHERQYVDIIAGFASVAIENAKLYEMATLDRKTGIYNHGYFQNRLIEEIKRAERYKSDLVLLILDLDHFKKVNDTHGHRTGDEVLIKVAETIRNQLRAFDIPARYGGEEFTVILPETDSSASKHVAERLRKCIESMRFNTMNGDFSITTSIGIAKFVHSNSMTEDILIEQADKALYFAKEHGRNRVVLFEDITEKVDA